MTFNRFGRILSVPIVLWSTLALVADCLHAWGMAELYGTATSAAVTAQLQWGRQA